MNALQYIEATQIEEIASQYQEKGYQIVVSPLELESPFEVRSLPYKLTATKCGRKLAVDVVEREELAEERLSHLREQAHQEGFDTFLLGLLSLPPYTKGEISGLEQELFDHLLLDMPDQLAELPAPVQVGSVGQVGFDSVSITPLKIEVVGKGVVEVTFDDDCEHAVR